MLLYFKMKILKIGTKGHNFANFNFAAQFNCSSMRLTTTQRGKSSWMNCLRSCRNAALQSTGCPLWQNKYLTCTSSTTWLWRGEAWWRSSTRNSGRRSSKVWVFHQASPQLHSLSEHSKSNINMISIIDC